MKITRQKVIVETPKIREYYTSRDGYEFTNKYECMTHDRKISRKEGILFLLFFVTYYGIVIMQG